LEEVVAFYNDGGGAGRSLTVPNQSEFVKPLGLTAQEQAQLVAFLKAMSPETPNHHIIPRVVPSGLPVGGAFGQKDSDNDGIIDSNDNCPHIANNKQLNTDNDQQGNACDNDDDNDGVMDTDDAFPLDNSESLDSDRDGIGNNADLDDDNDNMPDRWEIKYGLNPFDSSDANIDSDHDGLSNLEEYQAGTDPKQISAIHIINQYLLL
jgi:hypothetical protein